MHPLPTLDATLAFLSRWAPREKERVPPSGKPGDSPADGHNPMPLPGWSAPLVTASVWGKMELHCRRVSGFRSTNRLDHRNVDAYLQQCMERPE